jgi:hypothetical protein
MKNLLTFEEFVNELNKLEDEKNKLKQANRFKELAEIKESDLYKNQYAIQLLIDKPSDDQLILEHEQYSKFKKTTNLYAFHPENPSIPVKAHYHIYPSNSKKEVYAVNVDDGKAHHKKNRNFQVPKKEADELRALGVKIPTNNILESLQITLNESTSNDYLTIFLIIDEI